MSKTKQALARLRSRARWSVTITHLTRDQWVYQFHCNGLTILQRTRKSINHDWASVDQWLTGGIIMGVDTDKLLAAQLGRIP